MKTLFLAALFGALCLQAGCSENAQTESTAFDRTPLSVRIDGANAGELTSALVVISNVDVLVDGTSVPVSIDRARADLAQPDQNLAFRFDASRRASNVEVRVAFDDFGGYASSASGGELDSRGAVVRFYSRIEDLALHGGAAVHLDLSRSLVATPSARRVLVPQFDIR